MPRYDEVSGLSVGEMLRNSCHGVPAKEAIVSGSVRMTYKELDEQVTALAASLQKLGLGKGDMASIYMKNSAELAVAFYACQRIGVIVAWANPNYRDIEVTFILQNSGAKAVFLFAESFGFDCLGMMKKLRPSVPDLKHIIAVGGKGHAGILDFREMVDQGSRLKLDLPTIDIHKDLSMLIYVRDDRGS